MWPTNPYRYHYRVPDINADDPYPIKTETEGNAFRAWINDNYPFYAQNVNLDRLVTLEMATSNKHILN